MKERKLKARTIVPEDLYVERAADRQLREIVDEMGRPGYVLVARQMGKTNLLLHMKRTRADAHVLYFDLSSRFESARHWFRNVIDGLLESIEEYLPAASIEVRKQRDAVQLEPSVEYDRHLRLILRLLKRKTIIILDEIDSLINTNYSDAIFAQIRSMYFSRANHPEYENLTYVLSGVVEPTELIRDKNISPFNIGEKIYLENFDRAEVEAFINKSGVELSNAVVDRLFEWSSGNPRMTWDITSELELWANRNAPTIEVVDAIVNKLYLDQYDRPPIDHIRTLASVDKKICDAIVAIRYGKGDFIDQNTKNKLYLAGITSSAGGGVKIANKIVDLALSEEWMSSLAVSPAIAPVMLVLDRRDFRQAVSLLTELRASPDKAFSAEEERLLADSYLHLGDYSAARLEYQSCLEDRPSAEVKQMAHLGLGTALLELQNDTEAREQFKYAIDGPNLEVTFRSKLYEASLTDASNETLTPVIQQVSDMVVDLSQVGPFVPILRHYVLYLLFKKRRQFDEATTHLHAAFELAEGEVKNSLQLALISLSPSRRSRIVGLKKLAAELKNVIGEYPIAGDVDLSFGVRRLLETFQLLLKNGLLEEAINLAESYGAMAFAEPVSPFAAVKHLYSETAGFISLEAANDILGFALRHLRPHDQPRSEYLDVLAEVIGLRTDRHRDRYREEYIGQLRANYAPENSLNEKHLLAFSMLALKCMQDSDWRFAKEVFEVWDLYRDAVHNDDMNKVMVDFIRMRCLSSGKLISNISLRDAASKVLEFYAEEASRDSDPSSKEITNAFRKEADEILRMSNVRPAAEHDPYKHLGRNDRIVVQYGSSIPVEKKFKHVESDLRSEKCNFIRIVQKAKG